MLVLEYLDWMAHLIIIVCSTETEAILVGLEEVAYSGYCIYTITNKKAMSLLLMRQRESSQGQAMCMLWL